jgi:thioredoxin-like negative regulator of GroEL
MKQVLYFSAPWCQPCVAIKPMMQNLQSQMPIVFIDVDASAETAKTWNVRNIPTVLVIQNGQQTGRLTGNAITKEAVINLYNR